jgi:hypothetical protein
MFNFEVADELNNRRRLRVSILEDIIETAIELCDAEDDCFAVARSYFRSEQAIAQAIENYSHDEIARFIRCIVRGEIS